MNMRLTVAALLAVACLALVDGHALRAKPGDSPQVLATEMLHALNTGSIDGVSSEEAHNKLQQMRDSVKPIHEQLEKALDESDAQKAAMAAQIKDLTAKVAELTKAKDEQSVKDAEEETDENTALEQAKAEMQKETDTSAAETGKSDPEIQKAKDQQKDAEKEEADLEHDQLESPGCGEVPPKDATGCEGCKFAYIEMKSGEGGICTACLPTDSNEPIKPTENLKSVDAARAVWCPTENAGGAKEAQPVFPKGDAKGKDEAEDDATEQTPKEGAPTEEQKIEKDFQKNVEDMAGRLKTGDKAKVTDQELEQKLGELGNLPETASDN